MFLNDAYVREGDATCQGVPCSILHRIHGQRLLVVIPRGKFCFEIDEQNSNFCSKAFLLRDGDPKLTYIRRLLPYIAVLTSMKHGFLLYSLQMLFFLQLHILENRVVEAKNFEYNVAMCNSKLKRAHLNVEESLLRDIAACVEINRREAS